MDLVISKSHAYNATRSDAERCPTYRALRAAGFKDIWVSNGHIEADGQNVKLPSTLREAIRSFDAGKAFKLGTYRIAGLKAPEKAKAGK